MEMSVGMSCCVFRVMVTVALLNKSSPADSGVERMGSHAWLERSWTSNVSSIGGFSVGMPVGSLCSVMGMAIGSADGSLVGSSVGASIDRLMYPASWSAHWVGVKLCFGIVKPASSKVICVATFICPETLSR
jgi:hypothetical protein